MSLKGFHVLFIICSIALVAFFAGWAFVSYGDNGQVGYFATGFISALSGAGLFIYLINVIEKLKALD